MSGRVTRGFPMRTCVGCRACVARRDLLRVVAVKAGDTTSLLPDPRGSLTGRGAYVHPVSECLGLAQRRRAFTRALRVTGPIDEGPLWRFLEDQLVEVHEGSKDGAARKAARKQLPGTRD